MSTVKVEKQIDNYLSRLTAMQKKAVLTVVKTIALAKKDYESLWEDKAFTKEMDMRVKEYENGKAKLYQFEDMKKIAVSTYQAKKSRKK